MCVSYLLKLNYYYLFLISAKCMFFNNTLTEKKNKQKHTGTHNTQQMHLFVQNWRIMDYVTKILNVM